MKTPANSQQLGFDMLLKDAEAENKIKKFAQATAHLPGTMEKAIPFYRALIEQNHAAMLAADTDETRRLHREAHLLAEKQAGAERGILAHDDAPGYVLARATAAEPGVEPLWGQTGEFVLDVSGMAVRVGMQGMFGIGSGWGFWPGFSAHAVELDKPFISETGYRSFLGIHAEPVPGYTPEMFAAKVIAAHIAQHLKGKPVRIADRWRKDR